MSVNKTITNESTERERNEVFIESQVVREKTFDKTMDRFEVEYGNNSEEIKNLKGNLESTNTQLSKKMNVGEDITVAQINKNKGLFDETYFTDEFKAQFVENTQPISQQVKPRSITSMKLANKSVGFENTNFFNVESSLNLFDKESITDIGFEIQSDGTLSNSETCSISNYIEVYPSQMIVTNSNWSGAFYNEDLTFKSFKHFGSTSFTVPDGCYFYRQNVNMSMMNSLMICLGTLPSDYVSYFRKVKIEGEFLELLEDIYDKRVININNTSFLEYCYGVNLFDKTKILDGYIFESNGELVANEEGSISDYMEFEEGESVYLTSNWRGVWYDSSKNVIRTKEFGLITDVAPSQTKYFRICMNKNQINDYMVCKNPLPSKYVPYQKKGIVFADSENIESLANQLLNTDTFLNELNKQNLNYCAFGDSLTDDATLNGGRNYTYYVSQSLNLNLTNCGKGGTGYLNDNGWSQSFIQRVNSIPTNTDIITVFGSFNDMNGKLTDYSQEKVKEEVQRFIDAVYTRVPNVKIGIISPTPWGNYNRKNSSSSDKEKCTLYVEALKEVCNDNSIPFLDLFNESGLRPWDDLFNNNYYNNSDRVHPNSLAHEKIITPKIVSFLKSFI